ncbi:MAG: hypothetical protein M3Q34_02635 [bacterium]|nr:hypothetical protein [bacterium]
MQENEYKKENLAYLDRIALLVTNAVGTVWCAIIFAIIALMSLQQEMSGGNSALLTWFTQTFLQLVLMSVILIGQNIQTKVSEQKGQRDLETDLAIKQELEALIQRINIIEADEEGKLDKILGLLEDKTTLNSAQKQHIS